MKISELLRGIADTLDAQEQQVEPVDCQQELSSEEGSFVTDLYIPSPQLEMELMKKATGMESIFDEEPRDETEERHSYPSVMGQLRRSAGIPALMDVLDDEH